MGIAMNGVVVQYSVMNKDKHLSLNLLNGYGIQNVTFDATSCRTLVILLGSSRHKKMSLTRIGCVAVRVWKIIVGSGGRSAVSF